MDKSAVVRHDCFVTADPVNFLEICTRSATSFWGGPLLTLPKAVTRADTRVPLRGKLASVAQRVNDWLHGRKHPSLEQGLALLRFLRRGNSRGDFVSN